MKKVKVENLQGNAALRCLLAHRLDDRVAVPEELAHG